MLFIVERVSHERNEKPCLKLDRDGTIVIDNPTNNIYYINKHRDELLNCIRKAALVAGIFYTPEQPLYLQLSCKHVVFGALIKQQILNQNNKLSYRLRIANEKGSHYIIFNETKMTACEHLALN
ncbi:MAG: hypothetical protein N4A41_05140 [Crocinitomicaceae bacterium]|jgi:hypothetical protein|nr:hypothetical protein [Crocinitomicaceae bacterium]